jgi:4Fe-4S single cluster domain of Ferredoxin I
MANLKKRVPENVLGDFFVDSRCIDCDACRQIAPSVFGEGAETSFVKASRSPAPTGDKRYKRYWPAPRGPSAASVTTT